MTNRHRLMISRIFLFLLPFSIFPITKNFWFHSDDWFWFRNYPNWDVNLLETYSGLHFILIPDLLFNALIKVFGIKSFIYFELLLMSVNSTILVIAFEIVRSKTKVPHWIIVYLLSFWYTNPWGRENIRWPIAVSTNLSLLFTLLAVYLLMRKIKFPFASIFLLLGGSLFSSSWGFAYTPLLIGTVLDSRYSVVRKKVLILSIVAQSLCTAYLLLQDVNKNITAESLNIFKIIAITLSAPIVSVIAYTPYFLNWLVVLQLVIFLILVFKSSVYIRASNFKINLNFSFQFVGVMLSIVSFGFCVAVGRNSNNISVLLSSRFVYILGFLSMLLILLRMHEGQAAVRIMLNNKLLLNLLLVVNLSSLAFALNGDIDREKWERNEFVKLVDSRKIPGDQIYSCCNMDPSISPQVLTKLLNDV